MFWDKGCCNPAGDAIDFVQPAHSVRMFKLIENDVQPSPPAFEVRSAREAKAGESITFIAHNAPDDEPVLTCHWDFGDGSTQDGLKVQHAYTQSGDYKVKATATGLDASTNSKTSAVKITGNIATRFVPADKKRP